MHQMTAGALRQIAHYLLWDVHAERCQLTALLQYVEQAVSGQTGKHTDLKLTTGVPVEKEHPDDAKAVSSGRLSRVLSGEYISMTGRSDKQRRPHELILMSPIKSYVRSPFLPSPATPGDIIEEFEEMSSETDVCSSQCAVTNMSDTHVTDANVTDTNVTDTNVTDTNVTDTNVTDTNVTDTNVTDTNVTDTNVTDTNVTVTNVTDTNVTDTNVTDTNVTDTNVTDTNVTDTNVTDVNVTDVNVTDAMLTSAIEQTRIYKQVKSIFSDEPLEEDDGELAKSLGDMTDVTDPHTDVSNVSQINVTGEDCDTEKYIYDGNFDATATRTTAGEGDSEVFDGESVADIDQDIDQECQDQSARKMEDSPVACFANLPDEWYSLPPDVRYTQPHLTLSQLVQERRRITRQLQQLPSGVKVSVRIAFCRDPSTHH